MPGSRWRCRCPPRTTSRTSRPKTRNESSAASSTRPAISGKPRMRRPATRPTSEPGAISWTDPTRSSPCGTASRPRARGEPRKSSATPKNKAYRWRGCTPRTARQSPASRTTAAPRSSRAAADKLRVYNSVAIDPREFDQHVRDLRKELMPDMAREIPIDPLGLSRETVAGWVFPCFVRADVLALRHQRRFRLLSWLIFALAAAAVAVVAIQANFVPELTWLAGVEVVFLLTLLFILRMSQRWRLHDQWISCRFLAERLRSSYFLALAGTGDQRGQSGRLTYLSDSSEAWIERALSEVMARRPGLDDGPPPVGALRDYLKRYWIDSQVSYQEKTREREREPQHAERASDKRCDQRRSQSAGHIAGHEQNRGRDGQPDRGQPGDRHHAGRPDQALLLPAAEHQPVIGDRSQQQRGGDRGQDQAGQVQITLGRAEHVEPVGKRQRDQEPEQDLHPQAGHPQRLQQLGEITVIPLRLGLIPRIRRSRDSHLCLPPGPRTAGSPAHDRSPAGCCRMRTIARPGWRKPGRRRPRPVHRG